MIIRGLWNFQKINWNNWNWNARHLYFLAKKLNINKIQNYQT